MRAEGSFTPQPGGAETINIDSNDEGIGSSRERMAPPIRVEAFGESTSRERAQDSH